MEKCVPALNFDGGFWKTASHSPTRGKSLLWKMMYIVVLSRYHHMAEPVYYRGLSYLVHISLVFFVGMVWQYLDVTAIECFPVLPSEITLFFYLWRHSSSSRIFIKGVNNSGAMNLLAGEVWVKNKIIFFLFFFFLYMHITFMLYI